MYPVARKNVEDPIESREDASGHNSEVVVLLADHVVDERAKRASGSDRRDCDGEDDRPWSEYAAEIRES
jgi:hypothetical protein